MDDLHILGHIQAMAAQVAVDVVAAVVGQEGGQAGLAGPGRAGGRCQPFKISGILQSSVMASADSVPVRCIWVS